jgi:thiaminase (transcriptional activator TenA)
MSERFTEILRAASEPAWSDAVRHCFVNELFAGAVPDAVMARISSRTTASSIVS